MPVTERQIETMGDASKVRGLVLEFLAAKGYKVKQDSDTKIIAKHGLSAKNFPHEVEVNLDFGQAGSGKITLRMDHAGSATYMDRLVQELAPSLQFAQMQAGTPSTSPFKGMNDSEFRAAIVNLGLLEGEEIKLQYACQRSTISPPSVWSGKPKQQFNKGMLVFTNDNMIFMQQEGAWSSNYAQALRFPLESISGLVSGGTLLKHIRFMVGVSGSSEQHEFINFMSASGLRQIQDVRADIEKLLKETREEKKRKAIEAMTKGTVPTVVFCKYCGARNKADSSNCASCGAILT